MIIKIKNKDTLIVDEFKLKCCVGKNGISKNKTEGDLTTPAGNFKIGNLYWRDDRVKKPITKLICKKIKRNMGWCNDINSRKYNQEIYFPFQYRAEKLYRKDNIYDIFINIKYNHSPIIKARGSAIFLHLSNKKYRPTSGCVALLKKDFLKILPLINKKTKISIS